MAFTDTERAKIRMYLGWSARFLQTDDALQRATATVSNVGGADEDLVRVQIVEAERIDALLVSAEARIKASKVGPIELNEQELEQIRDKGRQAVGRMARILGVEVRGDAFSGALPTDRATIWGMRGGGGGYQLQG